MDADKLRKMQEGRRAKQQLGEQTVENNPVVRWRKSDQTSRVLAIAANCAECMGCNEKAMEPGFRQSIRDCPITLCSLYKFRPYK